MFKVGDKVKFQHCENGHETAFSGIIESIGNYENETLNGVKYAWTLVRNSAGFSMVISTNRLV